MPSSLYDNTISGESLDKATPLPGSLHLEWRRCGAPGCHCRIGLQHGPYWVRRWREHGKSRKAYVRQQDLLAVMLGLELWRQSHPPTWAVRQRLIELHQREMEVLK